MKKFITIVAALLLIAAMLPLSVMAAAPAYENDFSSGSIKVTDWKAFNLDPQTNGAWDIAEVGGNKMLRGQIGAYNDAIIYYKAKKFTDVTVEADLILERGSAVGIITRMDESAKGYQVILDQHDGVKLCRRPYVPFKTGGMIDTAVKYHIVFSVIGEELKAVITNTNTNESMTLDIKDTVYTGAGYVGFSVYGFDNDGKSTVIGLVDNVKIYSGAGTGTTPSTPAANSTQTPSKSTTSQSGGGQTNTPSAAPTQSVQGGAEVSSTDEVVLGDDTPTDGNEPTEAFNLKSKYVDVQVDNPARTINLTSDLNLSEIKDSFTIPEGYSIKIIDRDGNEVTDAQTVIASRMKAVFYGDGLAEYTYTIQTSVGGSDGEKDSDGGNTLLLVLLIVGGVLLLGGAGVGIWFFLRSKKKAEEKAE